MKVRLPWWPEPGDPQAQDLWSQAWLNGLISGLVLAAIVLGLYAVSNCEDVSSLTQLISMPGHIFACRLP